MSKPQNERGVAFILELIIGAIVICLVVFAFARVQPSSPVAKVFNRLTNGKTDPWDQPCEVSEEGRRELTVLPIKLEDIDVINPMGLMIGGHVTPIDHMYFYPKSTPGNRFSAEVRAMADGLITDVQHRGNQTNAPATAPPGSDEFRLTIEQTCNQGYYYDLITKLAPNIKVGTKLKAGDLIGYVGNQSLDFGVYDTGVKLNFIVPEHYKAEPWKIHTADAFKYFEPGILKAIEPKIARTAEPRAGKIDYDKDGYLAGNWFEKGTNGYAGKEGQLGQGYFGTHLAFASDAYDPQMFQISIGFLVDSSGGHGGQYAVVGNSPDPVTVNQQTGMVKYQLTKWSYRTPSGAGWDQKTPTPGLKGIPDTSSEGTLLVQLSAPRELKVEYFKGKSPTEVGGFTSAAKVYER